MNNRLLQLAIQLGLILQIIGLEIAVSLPPPEDIPEEVLRTEIIVEGRSPINGEPVTATEYAQIKEKLSKSPYPQTLDTKLQHIIFLLKVRKMLKPFVPIIK